MLTRTVRLVVVPLLAVAVAVALGLGACGGDSESAGSGEQIYADNCARCHGDEGQGGVGPQLGGGAVAENLSMQEQVDIIRNGEGGMPGWEGELSREEIDAVARYEREELGQ